MCWGTACTPPVFVDMEIVLYVIDAARLSECARVISAINKDLSDRLEFIPISVTDCHNPARLFTLALTQFAIVAPCAAFCGSLAFRLAESRTAGARLRPHPLNVALLRCATST